MEYITTTKDSTYSNRVQSFAKVLSAGMALSFVINVSPINSINNIHTQNVTEAIESRINCDMNVYNNNICKLKEVNDVTPDFRSECFKSLNCIACLEENWNENGADKFSIYHIEAAAKIVNNLKYKPDIYPTANDSIQFEFINAQGDYLEFELFKQDLSKLKMFFMNRDKQYKTDNISVDDINKVVTNFYGSGI